MKTHEIIRGWGRILLGYAPALSIEITRECPLRCPGCYAYTDDHLGGGVTLRQLRDYQGQELVDRVLALVRRHRPLHLSIVGGEPLVRYRELDVLLPRLAALGIHTQLVTSAVRPIPAHWARIPHLNLVVSIDGLPPEHDARRRPATYARILQHIAGHQVTVHCTVTRQQLQRPGYLDEFLAFWSAQPTTKRIWVSLYTPQLGEVSAERLTPEDRAYVVRELKRLRGTYPKLEAPEGLINVYADAPHSPAECIFARTTTSVSADLETRIEPCQLGGRPDCSACGCVASAGLAAVARHRLPGGVRVGTIFEASWRIGRFVRGLREAVRGPRERAARAPVPAPDPAARRAPGHAAARLPADPSAGRA
jgi:MoaA/NifB/PqqE/SkfB family radical SAM enzyme